MLFGREMRLPLDVVYRPPEASLTRFDYPNEVRKTLVDAFERARERLHLAHKRQKDYYNRRMSGIRFAPGDLVWFWSPVVEKGVAPTFHEPWTKPYTVTKRLSDITYEIQDQAKKKTKIVHFDRLKKSTLNSVKLYQSEEDEVPERSSESDSDLEQVAPRTRNVSNRVRTVEAAPEADLADAQETLADRPASPQHRAVVPQSPNRIIAKVPKALPVTSPVRKAAVKVPDAPEQVGAADAKAQRGAAAALTDANETRVSTFTNKGKAPRRYSPSSTSNVTITTVLLSLLFLLLLAAAAGAQDVIVLPKIGAVAEKIGKVAVDLGSAQFPMVLRLVIHDTVHNNGHFCLTNNLARLSFKKETYHLVPTWIDETR